MMITWNWSRAETAMMVCESSATVVKVPCSSRMEFLAPSNSNLDSFDRVRKWRPLLEHNAYSLRFLGFEVLMI